MHVIYPCFILAHPSQESRCTSFPHCPLLQFFFFLIELHFWACWATESRTLYTVKIVITHNEIPTQNAMHYRKYASWQFSQALGIPGPCSCISSHRLCLQWLTTITMTILPMTLQHQATHPVFSGYSFANLQPEFVPWTFSTLSRVQNQSQPLHQDKLIRDLHWAWPLLVDSSEVVRFPQPHHQQLGPGFEAYGLSLSCLWVRSVCMVGLRKNVSNAKMTSHWNDHFWGTVGLNNAYLTSDCLCVMRYAIILHLSYVFYDSEAQPYALLKLCIMVLCIMTISTVAPQWPHHNISVVPVSNLSPFFISTPSTKYILTSITIVWWCLYQLLTWTGYLAFLCSKDVWVILLVLVSILIALRDNELLDYV